MEKEGNQFLILSEIVGHHPDELATKIEGKNIPGTNHQRMKQATKGWFMEVSW